MSLHHRRRRVRVAISEVAENFGVLGEVEQGRSSGTVLTSSWQVVMLIERMGMWMRMVVRTIFARTCCTREIVLVLLLLWFP